jgi:acyl-CoA synthetase (AMP-forming)/AMP-acid ligase II
VELEVGAVFDEEELIAYCYERLAGFKKPSTVRALEALPRTAGGKPRKFVLREQFGGAGVSQLR